MAIQNEVHIRILSSDDAAQLERVAPDVFDGPIDARWSAEFLADPRHHLAVATVDGRVVGMASAVHYVHPDKGPELWVNEVGVAGRFQRQGIARRLLDCLFQHAATLGCTEAWVVADKSNTAARELYADVGGKPTEATVYFTFRLATSP